ncbi:MAG: GNAT family N-acetyltransferase [Nanoarchaeota archaeon]
MTEIRNYQVSDFPQVREILERGNLYWEPSDNEQALERKIRQCPDSILVAVEDERVVGTQFIVEDFLPLMFRLAVHPDYKGRGVGKALMQQGEQILRQKGYNHVNILVALNDTELQRYYERQGYKKGNTYSWMVKEL